MFEFFHQILDVSDFSPRWYCGNWSSVHGWLHVLSDLAIFAAYAAIPVVLVSYALRRKDVPFLPVFWLFAGFILFCGAGHFIEATIFWHPWYRLSGVVKLLTALISWATVFTLIRVAPLALALPGLARVNQQLQDEIRRRQAAQEQLRELADAMPQIVWTTTPDGRFDYFNTRWYQFTGFKRGESDDAALVDDRSPPTKHNFGLTAGNDLSPQVSPFEIQYRLWRLSDGSLPLVSRPRFGRPGRRRPHRTLVRPPRPTSTI